ncbi:MAG TPA: hypothetical protein VEG08_02860 [Terriglobales bacterium]|nr:hypothetical protein [Terriglobales bacterium]
MERIQFVEHKGKQILVIDFTGCGPQEIMMISTAVKEVIARQAKGSVLALADFTGARVNKDAVTRIKEVTTFDAPYVKRAAWVGIESLPETYFKAIQTFSNREFVPFQSRTEALDWLVRE